MLPNLIDTLLHPESGKSTCGRPSNNVFWEWYGIETFWSELVGSRSAISDVNDLEIAWKRRANKDRLRRVHRERGSNPVSICSFNDPSSVPERGHWSCTEDYSSMRGSLNPIFEHCKMIEQIFIRRHRMLNKNSRNCWIKLAISWSLSWTM